MSNNVTIIGNLTSDPELRFTTTGKAVTNFGVADTRRYQVNGEWEEKTTYFNGSIWEGAAENVAASLSKGDRVVVYGRLEVRQYTNKDGVEVTTLEVVAEEICPSLRWATATVTRNPKDDGGNGGRQQQQSRSASSGRGGGNARSSSQGRGRQDPVYGDEEPFVTLHDTHGDFRNMAVTDSWL